MSRKDNEGILRRMPSKLMGDLVQTGDLDYAKIYMVTKDNKLVSLDEKADLEDCKVLGKGQFGKIYAVVVEVAGETRVCALKELQGNIKTQNDFGAHRSITLTDDTSIQNNIIKLMAVIENTDQFGDTRKFALLPCCGLFLDGIEEKLPSLRESDDPFKKILANKIILHVLIDTLKAIKAMHDKGFVHGDIKPANITNYLNHYCLIDVEGALQKNAVRLGKLSGTPLFMDPRCFSNSDFCAKPENDIYSLGMVLKLLLGNEAILEKKERWGTLSLRDMAQESAQAVTEDINRRLRDRTSAPRLLETELNRYQQIDKKLDILAQRMTSLNDAERPTVDELIAACEEIRKALLEKYAEYGIPEQEKELQEYYQSLMVENDFLLTLDERVSSPLTTPHPDSCVFKPSLLVSTPSLFGRNSTAGLSSAKSESPSPRARLLSGISEVSESGEDDQRGKGISKK